MTRSLKYFDWIDVLKAIGIIFVVLGHTLTNELRLYSYIYSFHVPLFFFVSGFLLKPELLNLNWVAYLKNRVRAFVVPYIAFGLVTYLFWLLILRPFTNAERLLVSPYRPLLGMLYGTASDKWLEHNPPLWFLTCLFACSLIWFWIHRLARNRQHVLLWALVACAVIGWASSSWLPFRLPWYMDIAFAVVVFYGVGVRVRAWLTSAELIRPNPLVVALVFAVTTLVQVILSVTNDTPDVSVGYFGHNIVAFYVGAFYGIISWLIVAYYMPKWSLWRMIARNSLTIFLLHLAIFSLLTGIGIYLLRLPSTFRDTSLLVKLVFTVLATGLLLPVSVFIGRIAPWALGRKR